MTATEWRKAVDHYVLTTALYKGAVPFGLLGAILAIFSVVMVFIGTSASEHSTARLLLLPTLCGGVGMFLLAVGVLSFRSSRPQWLIVQAISYAVLVGIFWLQVLAGPRHVHHGTDVLINREALVNVIWMVIGFGLLFDSYRLLRLYRRVAYLRHDRPSPDAVAELQVILNVLYSKSAKSEPHVVEFISGFRIWRGVLCPEVGVFADDRGRGVAFAADPRELVVQEMRNPFFRKYALLDFGVCRLKAGTDQESMRRLKAWGNQVPMTNE